VLEDAGGGRVQQKQLPRDRSSGKMGKGVALEHFCSPCLQKMALGCKSCKNITWVAHQFHGFF
jgi:hypothetical protein